MNSTARLVLQPRALIARLRSDRIVRNNAIYLTGSVLAGLLGYVFHFETGHLLGPGAYAVVASSIAALYVLTLPVVGLQLVSARYASLAMATGQEGAIMPMLFRLSSLSLLCALPIAALLALFSGDVARFLNLSDSRVVYVLAAAAIVAILVTLNRGALQGLRRFVALSGNMLADMTGRLAFAAGVVAAGFGAIGAVAALAVGPALAYALSFYTLRPRAGTAVATDAREGMQGLGRYAVLATLASIGVNYLFSIDTLLAKHFLSADAAGLYAASAVLARVVYFLGLSITGVMFPEVAALHARNEKHFHVVDLSLLLVAGIGIALIVAYTVAPGLVLLPYGPGFAGAQPYLGVFALALTLLTVGNLLISYFLSMARSSFMLPLFAACVLETLLIGLFHSGIWQILTDVVVSLGVMCATMGLMYLADRVRARPATS